MSNLRNSLIVAMHEGIGKQIAAGASGLGGVATGGHVVGGLQGHQRTQAKTAQAASKGKTKEALKQSKKGAGRIVGRAVAGGVPGVGAVSNVQQQRKLDKMRKKEGVD